MKFYSFKFTCLTFIALLLILGCQVNEHSDIIVQEQGPNLATEPPNGNQGDSVCVEDEVRWFDLDSISPQYAEGSAEHALEFTTQGESFRLVGCLCDAEYYLVDYQDLPDSSQIHVVDEDGNPIPFSIELDPITGKKRIQIKAKDAPKNKTKFYISFDVTPTPTLERAGGLCIVDNLDGGYIGYRSTSIPDTLSHFSSPMYFTLMPIQAGPPVERIMIPTSITSNYTGIIPN